MTKIISKSYEECREDFFANLIKHAENKIKYWERQKGYRCEIEDNLSQAGAEISYCQDALKALEKQIAKNHFINECECIVDYEILYNAVDSKCKILNCYFHDKYRIVLRNNYPAVCINRRWFYIHILICEFITGRIRKGYIVHHKDKNKLNATAENLEVMTNRKHLKQHGQERKGVDFRSDEGKSKSINSAREARTRKDVTTEKVVELRKKGFTIPEIAKQLNCGINTVNHRLGMKES